MPNVSVIIPVYNTAPYLEECLQSVIHQTMKDIEIICVDDGSTDDSVKILKEFAKNDERIIILQQQNAGPGEARNTGLKKSMGKYIMFLDSDDYLELNACEIAYNSIEKSDSDIVIFGDYILEPTGKISLSWRTKLIQDYLDHNTEVNLYDLKPMVWNKIYRNAFLTEHELWMPKIRPEDIIFNFLCGFYTDKYSCIPTPLITYRKLREGAITTDTNGILVDLNGFIFLYDMPIFKKQPLETQLKIVKRFLDFQVWNAKKWGAKKYRKKVREHIKMFLKTLEKYYLQKSLETINSYNELKNRYGKGKTIKQVYLFGIPILTVRKKSTSFHYYLFGILKFLKISQKDF